MCNVSFVDVVAQSENGIFLAGGPLPGRGDGGGSLGSADGSGDGTEQGLEAGRQHSLWGILLERVQVQLVRRTEWPGGCQDYRPSTNNRSSCRGTQAKWPWGLNCSSAGGMTAPLWVAGAVRVRLRDVRIEHRPPWREDWRRGAWLDPASISHMELVRVSIDAAAP